MRQERLTRLCCSNTSTSSISGLLQQGLFFTHVLCPTRIFLHDVTQEPKMRDTPIFQYITFMVNAAGKHRVQKVSQWHLNTLHEYLLSLVHSYSRHGGSLGSCAIQQATLSPTRGLLLGAIFHPMGLWLLLPSAIPVAFVFLFIYSPSYSNSYDLCYKMNSDSSGL